MVTTRNVALIATILAGGGLVGWLSGGSPVAEGSTEVVEPGAGEISQVETVPAGFGRPATVASRIPAGGPDASPEIIEQRARTILSQAAVSAEARTNPPLAIESAAAPGSAGLQPSARETGQTVAQPVAGGRQGTPSPGGWGAGQPAAEPGGWGTPRQIP